MTKLLRRFVLPLILVGCAWSSMSTQTAGYEAVAASKLGEGRFENIFNESKTYVACIKVNEGTSDMDVTKRSFVIVDVKSDEVLLQSSVLRGTFEWINDTQIKISSWPGIVKADETHPVEQYIFDAKTRKKIKPKTD